MGAQKEQNKPLDAKKNKGDKLASLLAKKGMIDAKIKAQKSAQRKREKEKAEKRLVEVGRIAQKAGLLDMSDDDLLAAFSKISKK